METIRTMQDLVRVQKPAVERKGREVTRCFFYEQTGECFGERCFWTKNGDCPFWKVRSNK